MYKYTIMYKYTEHNTDIYDTLFIIIYIKKLSKV